MCAIVTLLLKATYFKFSSRLWTASIFPCVDILQQWIFIGNLFRLVLLNIL